MPDFLWLLENCQLRLKNDRITFLLITSFWSTSFFMCRVWRMKFFDYYSWLHDDSANDDSAIDKMAARFWHTDDSATFLFEKKGQNFFPTPHGFQLKTFPTPFGCQKGLTLPLTGFFYPWRELIFSLKKLFLTPNLLQIGKNGLNWPSSFFYVT